MKFTIAEVNKATQWCSQSTTVDCIPSQLINISFLNCESKIYYSSFKNAQFLKAKK